MFTLIKLFRRQYADLVLPVNITCTDCVVRLLRQASEWRRGDTAFGAALTSQFSPTPIHPWQHAQLFVMPHQPILFPLAHRNQDQNQSRNHLLSLNHPPNQNHPLSRNQSLWVNLSQVHSQMEIRFLGRRSSTPLFPRNSLRMDRCYQGKCLNGGSCNEETGTCSCVKLSPGRDARSLVSERAVFL